MPLSFEPMSTYQNGIKNLAKTLPSYIQDTTDMLQKCSDIIVNENDLLFTIDVNSSHSTMPNEDGSDILQYYLPNDRNQTLPADFS